MIRYNTEIKTEPCCVIYMSACPLLNPLQLYLEMSVLGLSICTATADSSTVTYSMEQSPS